MTAILLPARKPTLHIFCPEHCCVWHLAMHSVHTEGAQEKTTRLTKDLLTGQSSDTFRAKLTGQDLYGRWQTSL